MSETTTASRLTSHESTPQTRRAVSDPLHAMARKALETEGFAGTVVAGYNEEMDSVWLRWSCLTDDAPDERHLVMRASKQDYDGREAIFVAAFVNRAIQGAATRRGINGLLVAEKWKP